MHGDLSPGNVMITPEGQAMLVDFGLIRVATHHTVEAAGTPGYAAPEVWQAGEHSPASDRYSFGALAYYALTGSTPPQDGRAIHAGLAAHPLVSAAPPTNVDRLMSIFSELPSDRPTATDWVRLLRNTATTTAPTIVHGPVVRSTAPAAPVPAQPLGLSRPRWFARTLDWVADALVTVLTTAP